MYIFDPMKTEFVTARTTSTALTDLRRIAAVTREKKYVILERLLSEEAKKVTSKSKIPCTTT